MSSGNKASTALEEFMCTIDEIGLENTTQLLSGYRKKYSLKHNPDAKYVISMVARAFKIPEKEITDGVHRSNARRYAVGFCAYLLKDILKYEMEEVAIMLNRSIWVCYKHSKKIKNLSVEKAQGKKYSTWLQPFVQQVTKLIKK